MFYPRSLCSALTLLNWCTLRICIAFYFPICSRFVKSLDVGESDGGDDNDEEIGMNGQGGRVYLSAYGGDKYAMAASSPARHSKHTHHPLKKINMFKKHEVKQA